MLPPFGRHGVHVSATKLVSTKAFGRRHCGVLKAAAHLSTENDELQKSPLDDEPGNVAAQRPSNLDFDARLLWQLFSDTVILFTIFLLQSPGGPRPGAHIPHFLPGSFLSLAQPSAHLGQVDKSQFGGWQFAVVHGPVFKSQVPFTQEPLGQSEFDKHCVSHFNPE